MQKYDKRDVAMELLDAAVSEHLDHARHFAAYNLAAVAEELMSKLLKFSGKPESADLKVGAIEAISKALGQFVGDDGKWHKHLPKLKNAIKHMNVEADRYFDANIEEEARRKIGDAIGNLERLGLSKSHQFRRFQEHRLRLHRQHAL